MIEGVHGPRPGSTPCHPSMPVFYTGAVVIADTVRRDSINGEALATAMGEAALRFARLEERRCPCGSWY